MLSKVTAELILFEESTPDHWAEQWGSYVISLAVGFAAMAILMVTPIVPARASESAPMQLIFSLSPALEEPVVPLEEAAPVAEETAPEEQPTPEQLEPEIAAEAVATTVSSFAEVAEERTESANPEPFEEEAPESVEESADFTVALARPAATLLEKLEEIQASEVMEEATEDPVEEVDPTMEEWAPDHALKQVQLGKLMERAEAAESRLRNQRDALRGELNRREVETTGREFLFNSDGGREGVVRLLDVEGFPEHVLKSVYARYGIDVEFRYLKPEDLNTKRTYFNAVITEQESFTAKREAGYYEVFQLSNKAISLLASMEREAITRQNKDPKNVRVRSVTFGIMVDDRNEYILGVTDMQFERLR